MEGATAIHERLKALDTEEYFVVLVTNDRGKPSTYLVPYTFTPEMKKIILTMPRNTRKYQNILHFSQISLLIGNHSKKQKNLLETETVTIIGSAKPVRRGKPLDTFAKYISPEASRPEGIPQSIEHGAYGHRGCSIHPRKQPSMSINLGR